MRGEAAGRRALREMKGDTQVVLVEQITARLATLVPAEVDPGHLARAVTGMPLIVGLIAEAVDGARVEGVTGDLDRARDQITELNEQLAAAHRMIAEQGRRIASRPDLNSADASLQLEEIAGMLTDRVPHDLRHVGHLSIGQQVIHVLDRRLPRVDVRGARADVGWPGRRKATTPGATEAAAG